MTIPRKTFWLVLTALPILLLAIPAIYVLHQYLTVRDRLGTWNIVINDAKGTAIGHGHLVLTATRWTAHWSRAAPFVTFEPSLANEVGDVTFDHAFIVGGWDAQAGTCDMSDPTLIAPSSVVLTVWFNPFGSVVIDLNLDGDRLPEPYPMMAYNGNLSGPANLTAQIYR